MNIKRFMGPDEVLIGSYGSNVHLTDMRVIYHTGKIDSFFEDMMLDSIDMITYTKKHFLWMITLGLFILATSLIVASFWETHAFSIIGLGAVISASLLLSFIFLVDKDVILSGRGSRMELKDVGVKFIEDLRKECYRYRHNKKKDAKR
ncbi:MAG: hypothetical protein ACLFTR_02635 [Candidatus Woesearchaeota archaeon]